MNAIDAGSVEMSVEQGVAHITFFHPSHNSLPGRLLAELTHKIQTAGTDDAVRLILLKSAGDRTFCAGASFDELMSIEDLEQGKRFFMGFANVINACRSCPKLIIGRVQGKAVGGGVGLASATDYCFATQYASVKLSELAVGIGPFVVGPAVERKIGLSAMSQLAINATAWQIADWAAQKGLYTQVFDSTEAMDEAISILLTKLTKSNPEAMRLLKKVFWEGTDHWDSLLAERAAMSGQLVLSDYSKQAIERFKAKA
ncbi:MAG: enoyl-CoA hydratase/isomerase family protein [Bacteroidota bacterium]